MAAFWDRQIWDDSPLNLQVWKSTWACTFTFYRAKLELKRISQSVTVLEHQPLIHISVSLGPVRRLHCGALCVLVSHGSNCLFQIQIFRDSGPLILLEGVCKWAALLFRSNFSCQSQSPETNVSFSLQRTRTKCVHSTLPRPEVFYQLGRSVFLEPVRS